MRERESKREKDCERERERQRENCEGERKRKGKQYREIVRLRERLREKEKDCERDRHRTYAPRTNERQNEKLVFFRCVVLLQCFKCIQMHAVPAVCSARLLCAFCVCKEIASETGNEKDSAIASEQARTRYRVASISRLLKIVGLFCKRAL